MLRLLCYFATHGQISDIIFEFHDVCFGKIPLVPQWPTPSGEPCLPEEKKTRAEDAPIAQCSSDLTPVLHSPLIILLKEYKQVSMKLSKLTTK